MSRKQLHKGYERRQHDKQHDRDRNAYQKAKRKGITGLMDEVSLLKEEVHILQQQHDRDQRIIRDQQEVNAHLDKRCRELESRMKLYVWREALMIGAMIATVAALIYLTTGVS